MTSNFTFGLKKVMANRYTETKYFFSSSSMISVLMKKVVDQDAIAALRSAITSLASSQQFSELCWCKALLCLDKLLNHQMILRIRMMMSKVSKEM